MILIDTDIVIDHFHGHQAALDHLSDALAAGETLAVSVVTVTELLGGMRAGEEDRTERLLDMFYIIDVNEAISRTAGFYLRQYRRSHNMDFGDALIAATAQDTVAILYTRNIRHYPMDDITVKLPYKRGK
ncbi:MAG: type II toxin-antitoxin system VapC family toxin [Chloroflexota bacterium]